MRNGIFWKTSSAFGHEHAHEAEHLHAHEDKGRLVTVWTLFLIFVFGPCEPLLPLLMVPAFDHNWSLVAMVAVLFGTVTIGTMMTLVTLGYLGLRLRYFSFLDRHVHTLAGLTIAAGGVLVQMLGI